MNINGNFSFSLLSTLTRLITVPLEIGFGQSSVNVQDLENLQRPLQLQQPPPLQPPPQLQPLHKLMFGGLPANYNSLATSLFFSSNQRENTSGKKKIIYKFTKRKPDKVQVKLNLAHLQKCKSFSSECSQTQLIVLPIYK